MIFIAHRGNLNGAQPSRENIPDYIEAALDAGFDVELDVWFHNNAFFLGHDKPETPTTLDYLRHPKFWLHAKNIEALYPLTRAGLHTFFHDRDDATLTSRGYLWTYPGKTLTPLSIAVLPERAPGIPMHCAGVCSDFITAMRQCLADVSANECQSST